MTHQPQTAPELRQSTQRVLMTPGTERAVRQATAILSAVGTHSAQTYIVAGHQLSWMSLRELVDAAARAQDEHASRQAWAEEAMRLDVLVQQRCDQLNDALDLPPGTRWDDAIRYLYSLRAGRPS